MKRYAFPLLIGLILICPGCKNGTDSGNRDQREADAGEYDRPWHRTARDVKLPYAKSDEVFPGQPFANYIEVRHGTDENSYCWVALNGSGEWLEQEFRLGELRELFHQAAEHRGEKGSRYANFMIAADSRVDFAKVSPLLTALQAMNLNKFRIQTRLSVSGSPTFVAVQDWNVTPLDSAYLKFRYEMEALPLRPGPVFSASELGNSAPVPEVKIPPEILRRINFNLVYEGSPDALEQGIVKIIVKPGSQVEVGGDTVSIHDLVPALTNAFSAPREDAIGLVKFDSSAVWEDVVGCMDAMRLARVRKYAVHTLETPDYVQYLRSRGENRTQGSTK